MSLLLRRKVTGTKSSGVKDQGKAARSYGSRSVKYVELVGSVALGALGADKSTTIIDWDIPDGYAAELYALGIEPDFLAGASNLLSTEIGWDDKLTGIKFLTNHLGKNALPYGDRGNRQDIRLLDYPMRRGNLTVKFIDAMKIQVVVTTGVAGANLSTLRARAKVLLYEELDTMTYFGVPMNQFATIPGGVEQSLPQTLFADYVDAYVTGGNGQWADAYSKAIKQYEEVLLTHLGLLPDANSAQAKLYDLREKWEAPEYEPYFTILEGFNGLPFGDDDDYRETQKLPSVVAAHSFTNTTMKVQVKDALAASTISLQLLGAYRRLA